MLRYEEKVLRIYLFHLPTETSNCIGFGADPCHLGNIYIYVQVWGFHTLFSLHVLWLQHSYAYAYTYPYTVCVHIRTLYACTSVYTCNMHMVPVQVCMGMI